MNQVAAFRETVERMEKGLAKDQDNGDHAHIMYIIEILPESLHPKHIREMLAQVEADQNPQGGKFGEAKLGRWLGWAQAAVVAMEYLTLDDMKMINMKWAGK